VRLTDGSWESSSPTRLLCMLRTRTSGRRGRQRMAHAWTHGHAHPPSLSPSLSVSLSNAHLVCVLCARIRSSLQPQRIGHHVARVAQLGLQVIRGKVR
jgi:hypothetical protein